jgi:hypothetical protein
MKTINRNEPIVFTDIELFELPDLGLEVTSLDLDVQPLVFEPLSELEGLQELAERSFAELPEIDLPLLELDFELVELF